MTRLYMKGHSDLRKSFGSGGSESMELDIFWGSPRDSKLLAHIEVKYPKKSKTPFLYYKAGEQVTVDIIE